MFKIAFLGAGSIHGVLYKSSGFKKGKVMKPAISLYSFSNYIRQSGATLQQCVDKAAELGYKGVDILPLRTDSFEEKLKSAAQLGSHIKAANMDAVCYCCGGDFINAFDGDINKEIDRLKREADIAAAYGCTVMRHDATSGHAKSVKTKRGFEDVLPKLVEGYSAVTEYAKSIGIKTCVENHGFFVQDSQRIEKLINSVGNSNFGALVDIGNFCCADEDNAVATGNLAPYALHVHVKDFHIKSGREPFPGQGWFNSRGGNHLRGAVLGHGNVAVQQCITVLSKAGYSGYLCLEFEGLEDSLLAAKISLDNLNRFIQMQ